jgi:hypothetical protein
MMSLATDLQALSDEMGGLPLTSQDKDEMLKELDAELAKLEKEFKDSNDLGKGNASAALLEILDQQAELMSEKLQVRVREKMLERVPTLDWTGDVQPGFEDGLLAGDFSVVIDEKANEIFEDVQAFHNAFPSSPEQARIALEDIIETGETDVLKNAIKELKKTFGNTKSLEAQVKALVRVNKAFSKSYKALEERFVEDDFYCDVPLIAQELYEDFISQHKYVNDEVAVQSFGAQQIGFNFVPEKASEGISSLISKYRAEFSLTPDFVRSIYLNDETGLTPEAVEKKDWEAISMDILRIVTKGTLNKEFEEMTPEDRIAVSKQAIIRHAKGTYQSYKARGLTRAGKVASDLLESAKLAGEAVAVSGQLLGEMGAKLATEKLAQYRAFRAEDTAQRRSDAAFAEAITPEWLGADPEQMRMGPAKLQELGILPKARMSSEVSPLRTSIAGELGRVAVRDAEGKKRVGKSQDLQNRLDANEKKILELQDRPDVDAEVAKRLKAVGQKASPPSSMSSSHGDWVKKEEKIRSEVNSEFGNLKLTFENLIAARDAINEEAKAGGYVLNNPTRLNLPMDISGSVAMTPEERLRSFAADAAIKAAEKAAEEARRAAERAAEEARVAALKANIPHLKTEVELWARLNIDPYMQYAIEQLREAPHFMAMLPPNADTYQGQAKEFLARLWRQSSDAGFDMEAHLSGLYGVEVSVSTPRKAPWWRIVLKANIPRLNLPMDISKVSATTPEERAALKAEHDAMKAAERRAAEARKAAERAAEAARKAALRAGHDNLKLRASQWAEKYIDPLMPAIIQEMKKAPYFSAYAPGGQDYFDSGYMGGVPRDELKRLKADARDANFDLEKYLSQLYGVKVSIGGSFKYGADKWDIRFENVNDSPGGV